MIRFRFSLATLLVLVWGAALLLTNVRDPDTGVVVTVWSAWAFVSGIWVWTVLLGHTLEGCAIVTRRDRWLLGSAVLAVTAAALGMTAWLWFYASVSVPEVDPDRSSSGKHDRESRQGVACWGLAARSSQLDPSHPAGEG